MLEKYRKKRDFEKTPEPTGDVRNSSNQLRFVVQKHQASHLHYDFRLELGGVLKSWAVPNGPSLNPYDKRLAMMVEDHPFEYKNFEGTIPRGNYGAGTVMIWDEGTYQVAHPNKNLSKKEEEKIVAEALDNGHITFILDGQKLRGEFTLIKLRNSAEKNAWLLIKAEKDEFASEQDVLSQDKSIKSNLSLEEITNESIETGEFWTSRINDIKIDAPKRGMPKIEKPMMATLVKSPFNDSDWIFEVKWDGYRAITRIENRNVEIFSRNLLSFNDKFPEIVRALQSYRKNVIFDGEIVVIDKDGKPSFQLLQNYLLTGQGNLVYYVFDLLFFDNYDLTGLPLVERRRILKMALPKVPNILFSDGIKGDGVNFFKAAKEQDLEGIIGKRLDSLYQPGKRSNDWVKIKNYLEQEVVVGGFTKPRGSRKDLGSISVGAYEKGRLRYIGNVGAGFSENVLKDLHDKFKPLVTTQTPFMNPPKSKDITWLNPKLVAEVKFQEWTADGSMRQPVFLGLRDDKSPKEVKREII